MKIYKDTLWFLIPFSIVMFIVGYLLGVSEKTQPEDKIGVIKEEPKPPEQVLIEAQITAVWQPEHLTGPLTSARLEDGQIIQLSGKYGVVGDKFMIPAKVKEEHPNPSCFIEIFK